MAAKDNYDGTSSFVQSPIVNAEAVTPDDNNDLTFVTRSLFIGSGGDLKVDLRNGSTVTYKSISSGRHPIRVSRVYATDTTASDIIAEE